MPLLNIPATHDSRACLVPYTVEYRDRPGSPQCGNIIEHIAQMRFERGQKAEDQEHCIAP